MSNGSKSGDVERIKEILGRVRVVREQGVSAGEEEVVEIGFLKGDTLILPGELVVGGEFVSIRFFTTVEKEGEVVAIGECSIVPIDGWIVHDVVRIIAAEE